jgi:tetratricopeptide (TPR) repeat protein
MNTPDEYMEAAQLALEQGFPGDAKSLLDKGYVAGVLGKGATAERQQRLATMAQRLMSDDSKNLPQLGNETNAANSGLALVKLGETFASYGRYDDAIDAFRKGLQKGGLKYPEDAKLHLGVTYLQAGRKAEARDILKSVKGTDGVQDLAELWMIESNTKN